MDVNDLSRQYHFPEALEAPCPSCGRTGLYVFSQVERAPVHSVLLVRSREQALAFSRGDIHLAHCPYCGFITNAAFDGSLQNYSAEYEETQGFSSTFNVFHRRLAGDLIERFDLRDRTVIEIGCGKGEFISMLCEMGGNSGYGFDPAYRPERNRSEARERITFIRDFYSEKYASIAADFVCCKMTLEHIPDVGQFISLVRRSIGDRTDTIVFFQVPEVLRVLREFAFWDIYYEHCSYFSSGSLARLFRKSGFHVRDVWTDYDDQYLMITATPAIHTDDVVPHPAEKDLDDVAQAVLDYSMLSRRSIENWQASLAQLKAAGQKVVLWGGGSKAVAFLTTLGIRDEVAYAVDINPYKHGTFLAGTGHEIVSPAFLAEYRPDVVIAMNPIYIDELRADLVRMQLTPQVVAVNEIPRFEHVA